MLLSIILSYIGEGATDDRFFPNISERLIKQLLFEQNGDAAIIEWKSINKAGDNFADIVLNAAVQAKSCNTLVVHCDADDINVDKILQNKIQPAMKTILNYQGDCCKNISLVIPITETEAWMLVDKDLLKEEMNTNLSNHDLGLTYQLNRIENMADPKQTILDAIKAHYQSLPPKRRKNAVVLGELYEPISQQIELRKLEILESYKSFKRSLTDALKKENILN